MQINDDQCFECGRPTEEWHHVVPASRGGRKILPLCGECHKLSHGQLNRRSPRRKDNLTYQLETICANAYLSGLTITDIGNILQVNGYATKQNNPLYHQLRYIMMYRNIEIRGRGSSPNAWVITVN